MSDYDRSDYATRATIGPKRAWLRWLILLGLAFVAGSLAMGWLLTRWDAAAPYLSWMKPTPSPALALGERPPARLIVAPITDPAPLERRVAHLQEEVDHIADRAEAASGNANRAEAMLVAFAARRAVDRGLGLGYIEGLLRARFGGVQPQAVATVISTANQPITIEDLRAELDVLAPDLLGTGDEKSWWDTMRRELGALIIVHRADAPLVTPDARIERARRLLDAGHADRALAEIARLPARDKAAAWMTKARRYVAAHNALDLIETSALLSPALPQPRALTAAASAEPAE